MELRVIQRRSWGARDRSSPIGFLKKPVKYAIFAYTRRDIMSGGKLRLGEIPEGFKNPRPKTLGPLKGSKAIDYIQAIQRIQKNDMRRSVDIRYNFVIDPDGNVYKGRGWSYTPYLPNRLKQFTQQCIYIGYMGTLFEEPPTKDILDIRKKIMEYGISQNYVSSKFVEIHLRHVFQTPILDYIMTLP